MQTPLRPAINRNQFPTRRRLAQINKMGCFSTCFRKSKRRKSQRPANPAPCSDQFLQRDECVEAVQPTNVKEQENGEILQKPTPDSIDEQKEKLNISERKKVTFDLDVQFYEELPATDENHGNEEAKEEREKEKIKLIKEKESNRPSDSSSSSSLISFPPNNYRYQNCRDSDDEFDDEMVSDDDIDHDYMGDDEDEDEDEEGENEANKDDDDESLFARSMDSMNNQKLASYDGSDEIESFDSVLHPIENLTQWKLLKARANNNKAKENKNSGQECEIPFIKEPVVKPNLKSDKPNKTKSKNSVKEIAVDTSLSSWLAGAEAAAATPSKSKASSVSVGNSPCSERTYSPKDFEDRPILGVLTVEDIRQFSATSTPRRSPSRSPDDMPIIGSVGSYWN